MFNLMEEITKRNNKKHEKKMKLLYLLMPIISIITASSQVRSFEINNYYYDGKAHFGQAIYQIENNLDGNLWVFLSKDEDVFEYFKKKHHKGISLLQIAMDRNIWEYTPDVYSSFIKIIKPGDKFTILLNGIYETIFNNEDIILDLLEKEVQCIEEVFLLAYFPTLKDINKKILYELDYLSLPINNYMK